jgi:hypothetical protein
MNPVASFPAIAATLSRPPLKTREGHLPNAPRLTKKPAAVLSRQPPAPCASPNNRGERACVLEGTAEESPDMNTLPDAGGGSVSSF